MQAALQNSVKSVQNIKFFIFSSFIMRTYYDNSSESQHKKTSYQELRYKDMTGLVLGSKISMFVERSDGK
jgi:hypothetical protein